MHELNQTQQLVKALARRVDGLVQAEDFQTDISGFSLHRRVAKQSIHCVYGLGLGIFYKGRKKSLFEIKFLSMVLGKAC